MCVVSGLAAVMASARVQVAPAMVLSLAAWAGTVNRASSKAARPPAPTDGVARAVGFRRGVWFASYLSSSYTKR